MKARIYTALGKILHTLKLFPEYLALPATLLFLYAIQKWLLWSDSTNTIIQDDWIQIVVMAAIVLLSGNFIAHLGIKFNQNPAWKEYKQWIRDGGEMPKSYFKILCLYLLAFAIIIAAVM